MPDAAVRELLSAGVIESVVADPETAEIELDDAQRHLRSAELLVENDPVMAFTALYDATRKAVAAHMRARGFRPVGKTGYHAKTMQYAEAALGDVATKQTVERLDEMRSIRNDMEYRARKVGRAEVLADLETARRIVEAVRGDL